MTCTDFARERETCARLVSWLGMSVFLTEARGKLERLFDKKQDRLMRYLSLCPPLSIRQPYTA